MTDTQPHHESDRPTGPRTYRLGPRTHHRLFGWLSGSKAAIAGTGAAAAIGLMVGQHSILLLLAALAIFGASAAVAFWPVANQTLAEWAPSHVLFAVTALRRGLSWRSPTVGMGVLPGPDGEPEYPEALPPVLGDIQIIGVKRPGGPVGLIYDADTSTLCACLHVRLRAFGLLSDSDQDRRLESFGGLQDELARAGSPVRRLMLLHRTVPRRTNELLSYVNQQRRQELGSEPVRSVLEVIDSGAELAQEHELFLVAQLSAILRRRRRGRRLNKQELRHQAGLAAADQLDLIARRLLAAQLAVKSVDGALTPGALARLVKDQYDPFGRLLRDRLELLTPGQDGLHPAHAWPDATDQYRDRYRTDSADHVTWVIKQWPRLPVTSGWMTPLTLQAEVPVKTIAIVMEPVPPARAIREARGRRVSDRAAADTRRQLGQLTTTAHVDREQQGDREERELAAGHSTWRWEAYVTASVPAGDDDALDHAVEQIESGCIRANLLPVRLYSQQEKAFTFTLPLCRGLT
jgi:hypothetical protein